MTVKTRTELTTALANTAFDFGLPGDAVVRDLVDSAQFQASRAVHLFNYIDSAQHALIMAGNTANFDCTPAMILAMAALPADGGKIVLPRGVLYMTDTIHIKKPLVIEGESGGHMGSDDGTLITFPADKHGIIIHHTLTTGYGTVLETVSTGSAKGTVLRGFSIQQRTTTGTIGHGIWMRARAKIENCQVSEFPQNGIHIVGNAGSSDPLTNGNANSWMIEHCVVEDCRGHGLFVDNDDANAGVAIGLNCADNVGVGIYDSSFLGNTFVGCHTSSNSMGWQADNANSSAVFLGCYSETGQANSNVIGKSITIGGTQGSGLAGTGLRILNNELTSFEMGLRSDEGAVLTLELADENNNALAFLAGAEDHASGWSFEWHPDQKLWQWQHAGNVSRNAIKMSCDQTTLLDEAGVAVPGGHVMFARNFWVPSNTVSGRYKLVAPNVKATTAQVRAFTIDAALTADNVKDASAMVVTAYAASITPVWTNFINSEIGALTGALVINNPTGVVPGTRRTIWVVQDAVGGRAVTFGANFLKVNGTVDATASKWSKIDITARTATHLVAEIVSAS